MKKYLLITSAIALTLVAGCKKEKKTSGGGETPFTVSQTQNAAYMYFGGTWCGPCGAYGKPTKQALHEASANSNAVFISFQIQTGNDPFATSVTDGTAGSFGVTGVPSAFIGGGTTFNKYGFSNNNASNQTTQQTGFNAVYAQTARVNGKVTPTISGSSISVKMQNKFFVATTDEFYVNAYITESNLIATQYLDASADKKNIHDFVWRAQSGTVFYGDALVAAPAKDQVVEKTVTIPLGSSWNKPNCDVNVVIWRKSGAGWAIENSYKSKLIP
jgi:Outer membrane protein Omp28